MLRRSKELLTDPGIRYLEYYGMQLVRTYLVVKIMITVTGCLLITAAIVTSCLQVIEDLNPFFYAIGGMGGLFLLIGIILIFILPNRRFFDHIIELREQNAVIELKEIFYKPGSKSKLALLALIDLGEVEPEIFHRMYRVNYHNR